MRARELFMEPALEAHRLHFAFTITFHYLFPQLTMGLARDCVSEDASACALATKHYTGRRDFGRGFSESTLRWES